MAPLIEQHREQIVALCKRYGITRLDVFGSAARGDDFDPATSDADFFYEMDFSTPSLVDDYFDFRESLMQLLGREVDLVSIRQSSRRKPQFFAHASRHRVQLYAA